jgi:hypothetical protein
LFAAVSTTSAAQPEKQEIANSPPCGNDFLIIAAPLRRKPLFRLALAARPFQRPPRDRLDR